MNRVAVRPAPDVMMVDPPRYCAIRAVVLLAPRRRKIAQLLEHWYGAEGVAAAYSAKRKRPPRHASGPND